MSFLWKGVDKTGVLWYNIGVDGGKSEKESFSEKTQKTFQKPLDKVEIPCYNKYVNKVAPSLKGEKDIKNEEEVIFDEGWVRRRFAFDLREKNAQKALDLFRYEDG